MQRLATSHHSDKKDGHVRSFDRIVESVSSKLAKRICTLVFSMAIFLGLISAGAQGQGSAKSNTDSKKKAPEFNNDSIDSEQLPPGYIAPPERLSIFDLDQPIASKEEMEQLKKVSKDFAKVKNSGDLSPGGQKSLEAGIRYKLAEMTMKEKLYELPLLRKRFLEQVTPTSTSGRPDDVKATTQFIGQMIVKHIPELFKNQYHVRLQAAELLGELDYAPAYEVLTQVLQAKDIQEDEVDGQPEAVKIAAAKSLIRILRFASPQPKDRMAIAFSVTAELQKPDTHWWLQYRLIDALRYCEISGLDAKNNDRPFVLESLLSVIKDPQRDWRVRTRACYALGRVALPKGAVKPEDLVAAVSDCALQLSNAAAAKPNDPEWKNCIWNIYLAFHKGGTQREPDLDVDRKPGGLLEKIRPAAQPAYDAIVPIVNDIMSGKAPDAGNLRNLSTFVRSRQT